MAFHKFCIEHLLYPAMERCKGNQIRANLRALQHSEKGGAAALQRERLALLLLHCKAHVPAYHDLDASEQEIRNDPLRVLREKVPALDKHTFQVHAQEHLADNIPAEQRIANCTGGSTGQPIHFYMTRSQVETYEAARWRGLSWYGITPGSRSVMLWGSPIELSKQKQRVNRWKESMLKNRCILSAYQLSESDIKDHLRFLEHYKPEYLYGYATILTAFAQMVERQMLPVRFSLKAVVSTSETLASWQKELLERVFHCPVANEYGARDAGILAYSCPQGGIHITAENCVIEVLDPITHQPVEPGQSGVLAITDLHNYVQPRLRYMVGDLGTISPTPCRCGRALPTLAHIDGREDDLLVGSNGQLVHGNVVGQLLRPLPGLDAFQFRQHTPETATLFLVLSGPDVKLNEDEIRMQLAKVLPDTQITFKYVDRIAPTASGKMRYAIRECTIDGVTGRK